MILSAIGLMPFMRRHAMFRLQPAQRISDMGIALQQRTCHRIFGGKIAVQRIGNDRRIGNRDRWKREISSP